jgi:DNA-binding response OmpR family regulator
MNDQIRLRLLLVEDDESDVLFFERALRAIGAAIALEIARDGQMAVDALSNRNGRPLPDRILLDLKLPRRSGIEVLSWIRSNPALKNLSVTIMSSSGEPSDLARLRDLGIDDYIVKPVSYRLLVETVGDLCKKWGIPAHSPIRPTT